MQTIKLLAFASGMVAFIATMRGETAIGSVEALNATENRSVAPLNSVPFQNTFQVNGDQATFSYSASDGELKYLWVRPKSEGESWLGSLILRAAPNDGPPGQLTWSSDPRLAWTGSAHFTGSDWQENEGHAVLSVHFEDSGHAATIRLTVLPNGKSLSIVINVDQPWLKKLYLGGWNPRGAAVLNVPYDPFISMAYAKERLFATAYFDWTESEATSQEFPNLVYGYLTNGSYNKVHDRLIVAASWHLDEIFPNQPNAPSPYLKSLAGRTIFDIWTGNFDQISANISRLASAGIGNCIILIHNWQGQGYDNALPAQFPASQRLGGNERLALAVDAGKRDNCYVALHQNYIDYYPNYPGFDARVLAKESNNTPKKAFFNRATGLQSLMPKPSEFVPIASTQMSDIQRVLHPDASYLDVNSAQVPWHTADMDSSEVGAGKFAIFRDANVRLWEALRSAFSGPVFGEGANNFFWGGKIDGVEAQLGVGWPLHEGKSAPLLVDFSLLRMHPLSVNQGMGYYERWAENAKAILNPGLLDAYRMQEVAFGHTPFLGDVIWSDIPTAVAETRLVGAVAKQYGTAKVNSIQYKVGNDWVNSDSAAWAGIWTRVRIRYDNGLTIVANAGPDVLDYDGMKIPQFGWFAQGPDFRAYTAIHDGVITDYAESGQTLFANARGGGQAKQGGASKSLARMNSATEVIDFGSVKTNVMITIDRIGNEWVLSVPQGSPSAVIILSSSRFKPPKFSGTVDIGGGKIEIVDGKDWKVPMGGGNAYRWPAN